MRVLCLLNNARQFHHLSEFLNYESGKFSKSRNRGVFGPAAKETALSPSVWRYYLLSTRPETSDSTFSWSEFVSCYLNQERNRQHPCLDHS